jgi:hypothetical protein
MNTQRVFAFVSTPFRRRRMKAFETQFLERPMGQILDVGGTPANWRLIDSKPQVLLLNTGTAPDNLDSQFEYIQGDGCELPFRDQSFELVYSNSVIEHVGTIEKQQQFADEIRRVSRRYYVQTPNKWFPIEPHYLTPFVHFLPPSVRRRMLRNFTVWGLIARPSDKKCDQMIADIRLLDVSQMQMFFPEAEIRREKFLGLTKSVVAVSNKAYGADSRSGRG